LSAPVLKNLRKLIIDIDGILDGENNVRVFIYKNVCLITTEKQRYRKKEMNKHIIGLQ
jgi:hypothetical protein